MDEAHGASGKVVKVQTGPIQYPGTVACRLNHGFVN